MDISKASSRDRKINKKIRRHSIFPEELKRKGIEKKLSKKRKQQILLEQEKEGDGTFTISN